MCDYTGKSERKQKKNVKTPIKLYWKIYYRKNIQNTKVSRDKAKGKMEKKKKSLLII